MNIIFLLLVVIMTGRHGYEAGRRSTTKKVHKTCKKGAKTCKRVQKRAETCRFLEKGADRCVLPDHLRDVGNR